MLNFSFFRGIIDWSISLLKKTNMWKVLRIEGYYLTDELYNIPVPINVFQCSNENPRLLKCQCLLSDNTKSNNDKGKT